MLRSLTEHKDGAELLFVKNNSQLVKLDINKTLYVEALKDYVVIHTENADYTIHSTMKDIEKKLPKAHFVRVHRSFIVNIHKISAIQSSALLLENGDKEIPIGGSYKDQIGDRINAL